MPLKPRGYCRRRSSRSAHRRCGGTPPGCCPGCAPLARAQRRLHQDPQRPARGLGGPVSNSPARHRPRPAEAVRGQHHQLVPSGGSGRRLCRTGGHRGGRLWQGRRWAEHLTFVATLIFVPYEVYELTKTISALKVLALVIKPGHRGLSAFRQAAVRAERRRQGRESRARAGHRLGASRARHPPAVHPARRRFRGPGRQPGMGKGDRSYTR